MEKKADKTIKIKDLMVAIVLIIIAIIAFNCGRGGRQAYVPATFAGFPGATTPVAPQVVNHYHHYATSAPPMQPQPIYYQQPVTVAVQPAPVASVQNIERGLDTLEQLARIRWFIRTADQGGSRRHNSSTSSWDHSRQ